MKIKSTCAAIILFLMVSPGLSIAAESQKLSANHNFEFGFMYYKFDYKEDLPAPFKSTENGWLPGVYLGWNYNKKNYVYSKIFFEFSYGDTEFEGTTQSGTPIRFSDDNHQYLFRGEWDIGYNFAVTKNISIKPYTGYGYRLWDRGYAKVTTAYTNYKERYYWHYIPVGIGADFNIGERLVIEPNVGLRIMIYGRMTAYYSELDANNDDPEFKLGNRTGWYAELPVKYKLTQSWSFVIKPWYEYSEIGQSDSVAYIYNGGLNVAYEPSSRTKQYGVNVGATFSF